MRLTYAIFPAILLCGTLATGQALAQSTGTTGSGVTPQTNGEPGTMQGTPPQTASPQQGASQSGQGMNNNGMSGNNGYPASRQKRSHHSAYGNTRRSHSTSGTHGNHGSLNSNHGSNYPASGSSVH